MINRVECLGLVQEYCNGAVNIFTCHSKVFYAFSHSINSTALSSKSELILTKDIIYFQK